MNPPLVCPECNRNDAMQKVTAVVSGGTSTGNYSGSSSSITHAGDTTAVGVGYSTLHGSTSSDLAKMLAKPIEPNKNKYGCGNSLLMMVGMLLILILGYAIFASIDEGFGIVAGSLLSIGFGVYFLIQEHKYKKEVYPVAIKAYKTALIKWDRSYYCHRDDIVFDTVSGETSRPSGLLSYYYPDS